jgi:hypothetical protein
MAGGVPSLRALVRSAGASRKESVLLTVVDSLLILLSLSPSLPSLPSSLGSRLGVPSPPSGRGLLRLLLELLRQFDITRSTGGI